MEVHHHHHPVEAISHKSNRKLWKHYVWEFLMLFLAVFCGFLAENQREHYIEHQRAREYARSLLSDLVSDTATLAGNINSLKEIINSQEKMLALMRQDDTAHVPGAALYYYASKSEGGTFFSVKTATLEQLKNSGSLRYFKKFDLVKKINEYDQALVNQFSRNDIDLTYGSEYRLAYKELFSFDQADKLNTLMFYYPLSMDSILKLDLPLLNHDERQKSNFLHALENRRYNLTRRVEKYYSEPLDAAEKLIDALKKEYHFK
jgi:hypothetical protein